LMIWEYIVLGDFIYSAEVSDVSYKYGASRKIEKAARRFLSLAVIFVTGGLIWIFCISPCMVPAKMDVGSFAGFAKADVLNIAGIGSSDAYIAVKAGAVERLLEGYPLVESAKVVKRFPDRVSIFLEPRRALALTFALVNGRTQPVYFDRYGVVFRIGNGYGDTPAWLPIVSGIFEDGEAVRLGTRVSAAYLPLLSCIGAINDEEPQIWQAISEIGIAKKGNELFDVVLYPVNDPIRLLMASDINKDTIYYALLMLDVCRQLDEVPKEIDVRSGIGVVNTKEGYFGK